MQRRIVIAFQLSVKRFCTLSGFVALNRGELRIFVYQLDILAVSLAKVGTYRLVLLYLFDRIVCLLGVGAALIGLIFTAVLFQQLCQRIFCHIERGVAISRPPYRTAPRRKAVHS